MPPTQAHTAATPTAIAVFMPTLPPAAAADTTTQAMSKTDEYAYTISMNYVKKEPELGEEWKAWGINIRPVKY